MADWTFILSDRLGNALGELDNLIGTTQVAIPLSRVDSGLFTIRTDHAMWNVARSGDQALIKAYRNGTLMAHGPLCPGYQKAVQGGASGNTRTIQVSWSGAGWRLSRRLIEASKSNTGITYGTPTSLMDRSAMAQSIIEGLNKATPPTGASPSVMDTGIRLPVGGLPTTSSTTVGPWYYKNSLQAIMELSATLDGFDWRILPTEPTQDATGLQIGTFSCALAMGQTRPDCVFEYGDGKYNVSAFTETVDWSGVLNRGYSLPNSFPNASVNTVLTQWDTTFLTTGGFLYEDTVPSDLVTDDMRNRLLQQNLAVRRVPRFLVTFQPVGDLTPGVVPQYGTDYNVGDLVRFRAVENGVETINAMFRVWEVQFNIDSNGLEIVTPILISSDETDVTSSAGTGG